MNARMHSRALGQTHIWMRNTLASLILKRPDVLGFTGQASLVQQSIVNVCSCADPCSRRAPTSGGRRPGCKVCFIGAEEQVSGCSATLQRDGWLSQCICGIILAQVHFIVSESVAYLSILQCLFVMHLPPSVWLLVYFVTSASYGRQRCQCGS